jgi:hypothetical protein
MDKALRGNRLTKQRRMGQPSPSMTRQPREEEMTGNELLGVYATGGWKGKPHSTKEGRIASGERKITRFFYGRDKKKKKGTPV